MPIRIGMSGFAYPGWIGEFYPPGTKRDQLLVEYAKRLDAVEINTTFRRTPEPGTLEKWREAVPSGFRFAVKAHQRITHWKRLTGTADDVAAFVHAVRALGEHLGPVLFQVPPSMKLDEEVLDSFCRSLPEGPVYAFEPRDPSFETPEVERVLSRHGVARCLNDDLGDPAAYRVTGPVAYFRLRRGSYEPSELETIARSLLRLSAEGIDVYAFLRHEDEAAAVRPAVALKELVGGG